MKITVQDFINHNDNIRVQISQKFSRDVCDPYFETIWTGMLYDVPNDYRGCEVVDEGWLVDAGINQISIYTGARR